MGIALSLHAYREPLTGRSTENYVGFGVFDGGAEKIVGEALDVCYKNICVGMVCAEGFRSPRIRFNGLHHIESG